MKVSIPRLREMFNYDSLTGAFTWRKRPFRSAIKVGDSAEHLDRYGYVFIHVDRVDVRAHRAAWAMHFGEVPNRAIDHINGVKADNRICNLRLATASQNEANKPMAARNTSGHKGVTWHRCGKWQAQLQHNGKVHYLGLFDDVNDAAAAYANKAKEIHGAFANLGRRS